MRSAPGLLSIFLIAAGVACAELPPDLPPATPLPLAPGPVIGGTIKGNPAAGVVPVRELIEAVTTACVTLYNQRMDDKELLRCLTSDEINDQAASGRVGFGVNYGDRKADPESAVNHAIQSFEDGIYRIFLDDRALEQLEEKILLTEGSSLTFVRLTMLAGRMW